MKLKTYKKNFESLYSHSIEEVEMLLSRYGFEYIKNATEFVYMNGGVNRIQKLIDENAPETLQDVIEDIGDSCKEYWKCVGTYCYCCPAIVDGKRPYERYEAGGSCTTAMCKDIKRRLEAIAKRMGGGGGSKADSHVDIPKQKTCPHCGSSHVITAKSIIIGDGRYSETETDLCLKCGRDLVGDSE